MIKNMAPNKLAKDARKKLAANLQVLRRYDEEIEAIIDTTSHVVLYKFQHDSSSWTKKDIEGALFIFKRTAAPYYGFIIMNRLGLNNYTELLDSNMGFQLSAEFLIYKSSESDILGLWIYEESDRERVVSQLTRCGKSSRSAFSGQSPQKLYPRNSEEEREFRQNYPRSRSNSKRENGPVKRPQSNVNYSNGSMVPAASSQGNERQVNTAAGQIDLVSKLQALGFNTPGGDGTAAVKNDDCVKENFIPMDPAIVLAKKSGSSSGGSGTKAVQAMDSTMATGAPTEASQLSDVSTFLAAATSSSSNGSEGPSFKSPIPLPNSSQIAETPQVSLGYGNPAIHPCTPVIHPVPSPYPAPSVATPLPTNCTPGATGQQYPPQQILWQQQQHGMAMMGDRPSAHVSPAPPNFAPPDIGILPPFHGVLPPPPPPPPQNMAQNLAEQLVSLVRQRMGSEAPVNTAQKQQQQEVPTDVVKMQREFCRDWLIRVIQTDDELVDAFAQRFPPPIWPNSQGTGKPEAQQNASQQ